MGLCHPVLLLLKDLRMVHGRDRFVKVYTIEQIKDIVGSLRFCPSLFPLLNGV